jgi:hypothetical protein
MSNQAQENNQLSNEINQIVQHSMESLTKKLTKLFVKREKILVKQIQQLNTVSSRHMSTRPLTSSHNKNRRGKLSGRRTTKNYSKEYQSSSSDLSE